MPAVQQFSTIAPSGSDAHWKVAGAIAPRLLLSSSNGTRAHASIFNDSAASLYIKFGGGSVAELSVTGTYDHKITSGALYELPKPIWEGEIWGVWDAASGWAHVLSLGTPTGG